MGKTLRYVCQHCGKHFEAVEREGLECPSCFWSTSVRKEEEAGARQDDSAPESVTLPSGKERMKGAGGPGVSNAFKGILFFVLMAALIGVMVLGGALAMSKLKGRNDSRSSADIRVPDSGRSEKKGIVSPADGLTEQEKAVLQRRIEVPFERVPTEAEKKVLAQDVPFRTGSVEKLPAQAWTFENFKNMLSEQERFYKISLPRSYKKKLEELFQSAYVPSMQAFEAGNLLQARDGWVQSLAFPVYANDLKKHRGVVLTMLRPFINDTLSKIGALNTALRDQSVREEEKKIRVQYQELRLIIGRGDWEEGYDAIRELEQKMASLGSQKASARTLPPYPPAVTQVDADIQRTLADLLDVTEPSVADTLPMKADLETKKIVLRGLLPAELRKNREVYDKSLALIQSESWGEARSRLAEIEFPPELVQDAREKIRILDRLLGPPLDSAGKSG